MKHFAFSRFAVPESTPVANCFADNSPPLRPPHFVALISYLALCATDNSVRLHPSSVYSTAASDQLTLILLFENLLDIIKL